MSLENWYKECQSSQWSFVDGALQHFKCVNNCPVSLDVQLDAIASNDFACSNHMFQLYRVFNSTMAMTFL